VSGPPKSLLRVAIGEMSSKLSKWIWLVSPFAKRSLQLQNLHGYLFWKGGSTLLQIRENLNFICDYAQVNEKFLKIHTNLIIFNKWII
jgi:hypothetical protein